MSPQESAQREQTADLLREKLYMVEGPNFDGVHLLFTSRTLSREYALYSTETGDSLMKVT